jgi:outer membrane receptor for ferrienterochelin and colicins
MGILRRFAIATIVILVSVSMFAQATGRISGRVTRENGSGVGGVIVSVNELNVAVVTDQNGSYAISPVPAGTYTVSFTIGESSETAESVVVAAGDTATLDRQVTWAPTLVESVTVYSASRQTERIVEAPAAVSVVTEQEIESQSATGQLPKVIESAPGVDSTQSGLYDFNFNTRGFNSSLNRRILTLVDGRDPAIAFLGAQEWAALSFPLDEMASVELVRGPGSALYGPNAFNGVLNMTTKSPRLNQGGKVQLSGGDLDTIRFDGRYAGSFGNEMFYRFVGGYQQSGDFARSRNVAPEYTVFCTQSGQINCLPRERALELDEAEVAYGGLRLDKHFGTSSTFTIEGGYADLAGPVFQTGIGRVQVTDVQRPWARMNYNMPHWNFLAYYDGRKADRQIALSSGAGLYEDSSNLHGEIQGNYAFFDNKINVVGGVAYREQEVDTANPAGVQTLMATPQDTEMQGVFAQVDIRPVDRLRFVLAGRWDDSTLHDEEFSPKASIVYEFVRNHSVRLTYNKAFQVPNYSEFFLSAPAGAPTTALNPINEAFKPALGGASLGFDVVPILARGNDDLVVEHITGNEIGYSGIFGGKLFVTADYYQNEVEDFVTDLLPGTNGDYPFYAPPSNLPPQLQAAIIAALKANVPASILAGLTNVNGRPAIVVSYTNAGQVDTKGLELGFNYYVSERWLLDANYSWFDFEVQEQRLGDKLFPNAPEHKYNLGVTFTMPSFDISAKYRWVDEFFWAAGVFAGEIPSYDTVSLAAAFRPTGNVTLGATISNALDNEHYEAFGGDIIERRALGYVNYSW